MAGQAKFILVVDDEPAITDFVSLLLESEDYQTMRAHTGMEALSIVLRTRPLVIVLDIRMPMMSGWSVLKHLHDNGFGDIPVIAMSADYMVSTDASTYPIYGYLDKPFLPEQLLTMLEQAIRTRYPQETGHSLMQG